jgi:hypothetical protein
MFQDPNSTRMWQRTGFEFTEEFRQFAVSPGARRLLLPASPVMCLMPYFFSSVWNGPTMNSLPLSVCRTRGF